MADVLGVNIGTIYAWRCGRKATPLERLAAQIIDLELAEVSTLPLFSVLIHARREARALREEYR